MLYYRNLMLDEIEVAMYVGCSVVEVSDGFEVKGLEECLKEFMDLIGR